MKYRPDLREYAGHFPAFLIKQPARIGDKIYAIRDYPLILLGNIAIIAMMILLYNYSPFTWNFYADAASACATVLGIILTMVYWLFFVRRFGRYNMTWADRTEHPYPSAVEGYDSEGDALPSAESKRAKRRSRGVFAAFIAGIAMVTTAYCLLGFGMAPTRILNEHKADLARIAEIGGKYDFLIVYPDFVNGLTIKDSIGYEITEPEMQELTKIFQGLQIDYVSYIGKDFTDINKKGLIEIFIDCRAAHGKLIWYPDKKQWTYRQMAY